MAAKQYVLKRYDTGALIYTTSAIDVNNLVANGVAKLVKDEKPSYTPTPAPKLAAKTDESK